MARRAAVLLLLAFHHWHNYIPYRPNYEPAADDGSHAAAGIALSELWSKGNSSN